MSDRKLLPGKFVWFELVTKDPGKAQAFYAEVLGWKTVPLPFGDATYDMIQVGDTMIGGYTAPTSDRQPAQWIACASVADVDAAVAAASANGGTVTLPPSDMPEVGRLAQIADPQGALLSLLTSATDDPPDGMPVPGQPFWNELDTTNPVEAVAFYEKVLGWSHRSMDMGPAGTYYIIGRDGTDRGGITAHLPPGVPPHWLPYVYVEDPDATIALARKHGATIPMGAENIPGVGRFGIVQDPTGALLAVMKPVPIAKPAA